MHKDIVDFVKQSLICHYAKAFKTLSFGLL